MVAHVDSPTQITQTQASSSRTPGSSGAVRFPESAGSSSRQTSFSQASSLGLGQPPGRKGLYQDGHAVPAASGGYYEDDRRRRVRSAVVSQRIASPGLSGQQAQNGSAKQRRASGVDLNRNAELRPRRVTMSTAPPAGVDEYEENVFSDEYDLSHEDPKILEEVQHALKLKARREARQVDSMRTVSSASSLPSEPTRAPVSPAHFPRLAKASVESELDFAPRVGLEHLHPVPLSFNDGRTLDWGPDPSQEEGNERKWPISMPKRKRERHQSTPGKEVLDRQVARWNERTTRTRVSVSAQTLRKAEITRSQLGRRYGVLNATLEPGKQPLALTKVVGWYTRLEPGVQNALDTAEPFTWLKHLRDRTLARTGRRVPWHVSALLAEEFVRSRLRPQDLTGTTHNYMSPIPEHGVASTSSMPPQPVSPSARSLESSRDMSPSVSLGASLSRRRSFDANVSFEPLSSGRHSVGTDSRRSIEANPYGYRRELWDREVRAVTESPRSSLYSASSHPELSAASPSSSRARMRPIAKLGRSAHDSDDPASPHQSLSEGSDGERRAGRRRTFRFRPTGLDLIGRSATVPELRISKDTGEQDSQSRPLSQDFSDGGDGGLTPGVGETLKARDGENTAVAQVSTDDFRSSTRPNGPHRTNSRILQMRGYRTSLPSLHPPSLNEDRQKTDADEENERAEYDRRAQLLDNTTAQNQHNRHLLQRVANSVKEYEQVLTRMARTLDLPYTPLPEELLDAVSHDPAVITGHTRTLRGYAAVDSIHENLRSQQEVVARYLAAHMETGAGTMTIGHSVLEGGLRDFTGTLERLEDEQVGIDQKSAEVAESLARVKSLQAQVKDEYYAATQHTSAVYPELSQILTLEDGYNNRFQNFQEFAQDALTFILDAAVPFWRNYGKVIGVDVQDFLIVPWYRNEFTGEPKRYPIMHLPRRSLRHWVCLVLLYDFMLTVLGLQMRGVWISVHWTSLPYQHTHPVLWIASVPMFWGCVLAQVIAVLVETAIVIGQLAVMAWWVAWYLRIVD